MAAVPGAADFDIRYYITDEDGDRLRPMDSQDALQFFNKARCECGHQIEAQVRLKANMSGMAYDINKLIETFVGTQCATAEANPVSQFRLCAKLKSAGAPSYVNGLNAVFHPVWLASGIAGDSTSPRDPNDPGTVVSGSCSGVQGESGIWMCAQTNTTQGCQADEFFISGTQNNNLPAGMTGGIKFDFVAPTTPPTGLKAEPGDSAVIVSWESITGDINGFRVLCEDAATGKPPEGMTGLERPALDRKPNGTIYYTKDNLCPNGPFSTVNGLEDDESAGDDTTTTDGTTTLDATSGGTTSGGGTDTDVTGTTVGTDANTTTDATGTTGAATCGDGVVEGEEQCDDGPLNGDAEACHLDCRTDVCGDGLKGPEEECDSGEDNGASLCTTECTLNVSDGLKRLDWAYVCSSHLSLTTKSVRIEGLENGKSYNFLLVAYDASGNPLASPEVVSAAPVPTNDLWDQCKAQGDVCGESGFCNVAGADDRSLALVGLIGLGLGLGGLVRRRRRNRA